MPRAKVVEARWLRLVELLQDGLLAGCEQGALSDCAVVSGQGHQVQPLELMAEVASGVLGPVLGHPDQQQGQPAEHDVGPDPLLLAVVHRA